MTTNIFISSDISDDVLRGACRRVPLRQHSPQRSAQRDMAGHCHGTAYSKLEGDLLARFKREGGPQMMNPATMAVATCIVNASLWIDRVSPGARISYQVYAEMIFGSLYTNAPSADEQAKYCEKISKSSTHARKILQRDRAFDLFAQNRTFMLLTTRDQIRNFSLRREYFFRQKVQKRQRSLLALLQRATEGPRPTRELLDFEAQMAEALTTGEVAFARVQLPAPLEG